MFGRAGLEAAVIEMWNRRVELHLYLPISQVFRHLHPAMKDMEVPQVAAWGEANKPRVREFLGLLNHELANRAFIAGDSSSIADISGLVAVDFMKPAKLVVPEEFTHVRRWHAEVSARPSAVP